jgi:hypothetical protein
LNRPNHFFSLKLWVPSFSNAPKESDRVSSSKEVYTTRIFADGDEIKLANLFNRTHCDLAGFVPRSPEYWKWSCLTRPSVEVKGIVVITRNNDPVGYAVVGKTGDVWELGYSHQNDSKVIVEKLVLWATEYVQQVGSDSLILNEFREDKIIRKVCEQLGFVETPAEQMFLSIMNFPCLILGILQSKRLPTDIEGTFSFNLMNCPFGSNHFSLQIDEKGAVLLDHEFGNTDVTLTIDAQTLTELIFGEKNTLKMALNSKVKVKPFWKTQRGLKLISHLKVDCPWFIPKADIG